MAGGKPLSPRTPPLPSARHSAVPYPGHRSSLASQAARAAFECRELTTASLTCLRRLDMRFPHSSAKTSQSSIDSMSLIRQPPAGELSLGRHRRSRRSDNPVAGVISFLPWAYHI
jgi:hypothetical protein